MSAAKVLGDWLAKSQKMPTGEPGKGGDEEGGFDDAEEVGEDGKPVKRSANSRTATGASVGAPSVPKHNLAQDKETSRVSRSAGGTSVPLGAPSVPSESLEYGKSDGWFTSVPSGHEQFDYIRRIEAFGPDVGVRPKMAKMPEAKEVVSKSREMILGDIGLIAISEGGDAELAKSFEENSLHAGPSFDLTTLLNKSELCSCGSFKPVIAASCPNCGIGQIGAVLREPIGLPAMPAVDEDVYLP